MEVDWGGDQVTSRISVEKSMSWMYWRLRDHLELSKTEVAATAAASPGHESSVVGRLSSRWALRHGLGSRPGGA